MRSCRHLPLLLPERTAAMNWNQLQYIVTTAQEKSITKAAKKLFISQPSLTLSIQNLEKELGVELFERNRGSFTLTYAGQLYYDWALSTLHSKERLGDRLGDIREGHSHLIRLGISPHRSATLLPVILPRFYEKFPASEIFLEEKPTFQLRALLEDDKLDLIVDVPHPDTLEFTNTFLADERLILAVPSSYMENFPEFSKDASLITLDSGAASPGVVPLQLFRNYPFFMLSDPQNLAALSRRIYESAGFIPQTRLVCNNIFTALNMVQKQLGIVIAPGICAHPDHALEGIRYFHMDPQMAGQMDTRQICLIRRKSLYLHAGLRTLIDLFIELTPEMYG